MSFQKNQFLVKPGEFFYHFKRDISRGIENHAYVIIGIGQDTEERTKYYVTYKPLYFCDTRHEDEKGVSFHIRPYHMFIEEVNRPEYKGPRFIKITDEKTIQYLKNHELYTSKFMDE
jgi:hypothetical protein